MEDLLEEPGKAKEEALEKYIKKYHDEGEPVPPYKYIGYSLSNKGIALAYQAHPIYSRRDKLLEKLASAEGRYWGQSLATTKYQGLCHQVISDVFKLNRKKVGRKYIPKEERAAKILDVNKVLEELLESRDFEVHSLNAGIIGRKVKEALRAAWSDGEYKKIKQWNNELEHQLLAIWDGMNRGIREEIMLAEFMPNPIQYLKEVEEKYDRKGILLMLKRLVEAQCKRELVYVKGTPKGMVS